MTLSPKLPPARAPNWFPVLSPTRFGEMVATGKPASSPGKFPGSTLRVGWFLGTRLWVIDWKLSGQNGWNNRRETPFSRNPTWGDWYEDVKDSVYDSYTPISLKHHALAQVLTIDYVMGVAPNCNPKHHMSSETARTSVPGLEHASTRCRLPHFH